MCLHTTLFNLAQKHDFSTVVSTLAAIAREQQHLRLTGDSDRPEQVIADEMIKFDNAAQKLYDVSVEVDNVELL